jgi:hypothetical protein
MLAAAAFMTSALSAALMAAEPKPSYDNLIIPRNRVGPVRLGQAVSSAIAQLGKPDKVIRGRDPAIINGRPAPDPLVYIWRGRTCLNLHSVDEGLEPQVRSIYVTCDRWRTAEGIGLGSLPKQIVVALGQPDTLDCNANQCFLKYHWLGLRFWSRGRDQPVHEMHVLPGRED